MKLHHVFLFFVFQLLAVGVSAQQVKQVQIDHANTLEGREDLGPNVRLLLGEVVFSHEGSKMHCDSAYFYQLTNSLDAFGHIHINRGDSVHLYGDTLKYDGNTKIAKVLNNVLLKNDSLTLKTNILDFYMDLNMAVYFNGGETINKEDTLRSNIGRYYTNAKFFHFSGDVEVSNPRFEMTCDTLKHQTVRQISYFLGPTEIVGDSNYIYCENGWYNHKLDQTQLKENAHYKSKSYTLKGDSLFYDRKKGFGEVFQNISMQDTSQRVIIYGDYASYREADEFALVTDSAIFAQYDSKGDTLFMHADTMMNMKVMKDTLEMKYVKAYRGVRSWRKDLQMVCDSLVYSYNDSTIELHHSPIIWAEQNQMFADFIKVFMKDNRPDYIEFTGNALAASQEGKSVEFFNQLKGKDMLAKFRNGQIHKVSVDKNGEVIYMVVEEERVTGINKAESEKIVFYLEDKKLDGVLFPTKTKGAILPLADTTDNERKLNNFEWHATIRPKNKKDIFGSKQRKEKPEDEPETLEIKE